MSVRELGNQHADFESYFLRWNSVLFYPNPENTAEAKKILHGHSGEAGVIPCHQHKTCEALVRADSKFPPRVCPHCGIDTNIELTEEERAWLPSL